MKLDIDNIRTMVCEGIPFVKNTGVELLDLKRGYVKMKMPLKGNQNHINVMYVGAQSVLADLPGGALFLTAFDFPKYVPVVKEMNTKYKKPAKTDLFIEGHLTEDEIQRVQKEMDENGKSDYRIHFDLVDTDGVTITEADVLFTGIKMKRS